MPSYFADTFTGTVGTDLTAHTPDVGASYALNPSTSGTIVLDGVGGCYGTATGPTLYACSPGPGSTFYQEDIDLQILTHEGSAGVMAFGSGSGAAGWVAYYDATKQQFILRLLQTSIVSVVPLPLALGTHRLTWRTIYLGGQVRMIVSIDGTTVFDVVGGAGAYAFGLYTIGTVTPTTGVHLRNLDVNMQSAPSIIIYTPTPSQAFRNINGGTRDIQITGVYYGSPTAIEASRDGVTWTTIVANPSGGSFAVPLDDVPEGRHAISIRYANDHAQLDSVPNVRVCPVLGVTGQSNSTGQGANFQECRPYTDGVSLYIGPSSMWVEMGDPSGGDKGSCWPILATLLSYAVRRPLGFTIYGFSGLQAVYFQPGTAYYNAVVAALGQAGGCDVVLFWEGESDAIVGTTQDQYLIYMNGTNNGFKTDVNPDLKLMPCLIQNCTGIGTAGQEVIRAAIRQAWADPGFHVGPDFSDTDTDDAYHFISDLKIALAASRWSDAVRKASFGQLQGGGGGGGIRVGLQGGFGA